MEKFNKIILDNGLRIITVSKPDSLAMTVLVLVEAGSKYETKKINGISHFLEHMCFKGTKKRPKSIDIFSELDAIGASYNAFTGHEYTGYYAKARPENFNIILDVVSDIYLNPIFNQKEIEKERGVIIEEINMYEDLPQKKVGDLFINLLYGDQPAGWDIAGRKEIIQKLNQEDFIKYKSEHYLSQSTLVVIAGKFGSETVEKTKKIFSAIKTGKKIPKLRTGESQSKPEILLKSKKTDQTHLMLGVRAFDIFDKRKYALFVLSSILGGGMSSRLFQKVREKLGAAYYVHSEENLFTDHGYLVVSAGVDNKRVDIVVEAILEEFKKLIQKPVSQKEIKRVKNNLIGHLFLSLETSNQIADFYGSQEILTGKIISPDEAAKKIQAVEAGEVQSAARDIFQNNKLNLALIGPFEDKMKFEKILGL